MQPLQGMYSIMRMINLKKGFTLIEVVIVIVSIGIIAYSSSLLMKGGFQSYFTGVTSTGLSTQAAIAMTRMTKELQQAVSFSTSSSANSVTFVTTGGSTITYNGSALPNLSRVGTGTNYLGKQVTVFSLAYYDKTFAALAVPLVAASSTRAVTISLTFSNGTESVPLINTVYLPNMFG